MSSENQEVATPVAQPEQQNSVLSGDPKTETPKTNADWKASLSNELRADKSLENIKLENPLDHEHKQWQVDIAVGDDIGFRLNKDGVYELVTDLQTWKQPIPPKRFIEKVTQQYARMTVHNTVKDLGFEVQEEWEMDDNSIELTVTRWV